MYSLYTECWKFLKSMDCSFFWTESRINVDTLKLLKSKLLLFEGHLPAPILPTILALPPTSFLLPFLFFMLTYKIISDRFCWDLQNGHLGFYSKMDQKRLSRIEFWNRLAGDLPLLLPFLFTLFLRNLKVWQTALKVVVFVMGFRHYVARQILAFFAFF